MHRLYLRRMHSDGAAALDDNFREDIEHVFLL
jgi:hypothetical protein